MTAIAMCCGLLVACSTATTPKTLFVEVRVCKGDPLAARDAVRHLSDGTIVTLSGRPAFFRAGGEVPLVTDGKKVEYVFLGTEVEVLPLAQSFGTAWVEVNLRHVTQTPGITTKTRHVPGFSEQTWRHTRVVKLGETHKYRVAANDPNDQVWVEVTVRAAGATK
jgi:hypothetical protein